MLQNKRSNYREQQVHTEEVKDEMIDPNKLNLQQYYTEHTTSGGGGQDQAVKSLSGTQKSEMNRHF